MKTTARSATAERYLSLRAIRTLVRWDEWYDSKVPLLFICFYQMCLVQPIPARQVIVRFTLVTAFACLYLAFGYLINDYSDRETDRLAGKLKLIASLPAPAAVVLLCLLGLAGMAIPLFLIGNRVLALGLTAVAYFFAAFYSMPPVRFKERGVWGLVVSAVAQRSLPALIIFAAFDHFGLDSWLLFVLLALIGVRWILVHQLIDLQNDREAGVSTFAAHAGRATDRGADKVGRVSARSGVPDCIVCLRGSQLFRPVVHTARLRTCRRRQLGPLARGEPAV